MVRFCQFAAISASVILFSSAGSAQQFPSPFGQEDTIGAANRLNPQIVLDAAKLVTTGKAYSLGVVTGPETPAPFGRWTKMAVFPIGPLGENKLTGHDDLLVSYLGLGSQIDGLGHVGVNGVHYNNIPASDFGAQNGLTKLGAEHIPPIVSRGVLIDMTKHFSKKRLKSGDVFNSPEIKAAAEAQGVSIREGDVVLFHTGWMEMAEKGVEKYVFDAPGLGVEGARWLADQGVVAVGADTAGLEVTPAENPADAFPVHVVLLAENGIYILENINTAELAGDEAYEFLFVLGQPKFAGSVQAVINPIAIR